MGYKNLLITGANGCVGQDLVDWFLKNTKFRLYLMVRDKSKLPISVQENKKVKLMICDIRESNKYKREISQINYLTNFPFILI